MQNAKTHIVIGAVEGGKPKKKGGNPERKITVLYIGPDRHEAREIYLENKENLDLDFVGMDTLAGFKSRARPKIDAQVAKDRAAALAKQTEAEINEKARIAEAAAVAAGKAQLEAEAEKAEAEEKLKTLIEKSGATLEDDDELTFVGDEELVEALEEEELEDDADALLK